MKTHFEQLLVHLQKKLAPIYLIFGEEYLLRQQAADAVRSAAAQAGFTERVLFTLEPQFDWDNFQEATQNFSLFSLKQCIELRINEQKLNENGKQAILDYAENPSSSQLLLITLGKLDAAEQNSAWFKAVEKIGVVVQIWPMQRPQVLAWILQRLKKLGFSADANDVTILADRTEGNLLATHQEIEKIALLYPPGKLNAEQIAKACVDNARFDVFDLVDAALQGQAPQVVRILEGLKQEGTEPTLILWALARELRQLIAIAQTLAQGAALAGALAKHKVWEKRKASVQRTLKLHSLSQLQLYLQKAAVIDSMIKGGTPGNVWEALLQLALNLTKDGFAIA